MADPEWSSPYCREFIHPDASWDVAYFEAVLVNLELNFTVSYLGSAKSTKLLIDRTAAGIPAIFYWFSPDVLLQQLDGTPSSNTQSARVALAAVAAPLAG
eukprot:7408297-Pyramimonas_sp.AAC.1